MTELLSAISGELQQSLTEYGLQCFTTDTPHRDQVVLFVAGPTPYKLDAVIAFDWPNVRITLMIPLSGSKAWQQAGQYNYDLNDPRSIDEMFGVIKTHCDRLTTGSESNRGHRSKLTPPNRSKQTPPPTGRKV